MCEQQQGQKCNTPVQTIDVTTTQLATDAAEKIIPQGAPSVSAQIFPTLEKNDAHTRSRYIPTSIKRAVWVRDSGRCTYTDAKTGRKCESTHALQYDHALPFALGGETNEDNLRLRCQAHNAHTAIRQGLSKPN